MTFGDYICKSGGLIDSSPALGVAYVSVSMVALVIMRYQSDGVGRHLTRAWGKAQLKRAGLVYKDV